MVILTATGTPFSLWRCAMSSSAFKQFEHQAWESVVREYDAAFSRLTQQVIPAVIDVVAVKPRTILLDVAGGPGYLAAAAKTQGAMASGTDFSSEGWVESCLLSAGWESGVEPMSGIGAFQTEIVT